MILTKIKSHFTPLQDTIRVLFSVVYDGVYTVSRPEARRSTRSRQAFINRADGYPEGVEFIPWLRRRLSGRWLRHQICLWKLGDKLCGLTGERRKQEYVEFLLADKYFSAMANILSQGLRHERLSMVCCEANALCPGGLALAAIRAQEGDTVALVSGVSYPLVLRPNEENRFRVVGPLFLPGVMDGELKEALKPELFHEIVLV